MLDTNVLISACLKPQGLEAQTVQLAQDSAFTLCISSAVWAEYNDVLGRTKLKHVRDRAAELLAGLQARAVLVETAVELHITADEDDNRLLECASAAAASYLVTGNRRHFPAAWNSAQIVNAREFLTAAFGALIA